MSDNRPNHHSEFQVSYLGLLTKKQRDAVFPEFGPEPNMQLYKRGIRRRLAPMVQGDRRSLEESVQTAYQI